MKMCSNSALALAILLLGLGFGTPAQAADTVAEIQSLVNRGQNPQALVMAERVLAANAKDPQARFLKGIALTELDRPDEAIAVFQKLTEDFPELPEPYNNLAVLFAQERQYEKARSALEMAIRTHPSYATAHENLGDVYARLASQAYDKALQLDSDNAAAQSKLALIREMFSAPSQGIGNLRTAGASAAGNRPAAPAAPARTSAATNTPAPSATVAAAQSTVPEVPAPGPSGSLEPAALPTAPRTPAAAAPPAAVGPAATAATVAAPTVAADEREAIKVVEAWAAAWSRKDVKSYLSYYDRTFQVPGGRARSAWQRERERRVGKPGTISVEVMDPVARVIGDVATVRFSQKYDSVGYDASTMKTLELVRRDGSWRIRRERIGG